MKTDELRAVACIRFVRLWFAQRFSPSYWRAAYEREKKERLRIADSKWWYKHRVEMLAENQKFMRDPERTLVCDIIANGQLLPDPHGTRYSKPNAAGELQPPPNNQK